MKWIKKIKERFTGLTDAIARFPLTTLFLLEAAMTNAYMISSQKDNSKFLLTFAIGAFLSAVSQVAYERFFTKFSSRFILMGAAAILTAGYYNIIMQPPAVSMENEIRSAVTLFALLIAFIWVPVIRSKISFNKSCLISFKAFFNSLFFSGVIFGGISLILAAFDQLIFNIDYTAYPHTANIVFIIFAPIYFLSLIPLYPGTGDKKASHEQQKETIDMAASCPKFLEILLSYIVIPLIAVFTLILVIYIIKNIGGKFWTDNLLEPMLISYSITVISVYILASEIENMFSVFFRRIFPKVLVPIVLFQIISSIISVEDTGVTHTRYYVILFGIYAAAAGIILSFIPVRKNGVIAAMLIIFAAVSIVPPVDAFTISRTSQTHMLKNVLEKNNMLENNKIRPNESISNNDKKTITNAVHYLYMMNYTKEIKWLPDDFNAYEDFQTTFGFKEYQERVNFNQPIYLGLNQQSPIKITDSDIFVQMDLYLSNENGGGKICDFKKKGKVYTLLKEYNKDKKHLKLMGENDQELISFNTQNIYDKFYHYTGKELISAEEATFAEENDRVKMTIVVQNVSIDKQNEQNNNAHLFVFVHIK